LRPWIVSAVQGTESLFHGLFKQKGGTRGIRGLATFSAVFEVLGIPLIAYGESYRIVAWGEVVDL
jgi:hypothetical protein